MGFFETLLFILAGQYIHVLVKLLNAYKQFRAEFKIAIFFSDFKNKLTLIINGSLILIFSVMLTRAGFHDSLNSMILSASPLSLFGVAVPASLWINLAVYVSYLTTGYFIQSIFYWLLRKALKKTKVEPVEEEKI